MALGPSVLLPPLQDIQRRIAFIDEKYAGKMFLDVLIKEEEGRIAEMGGAPRSVVYNFLTMLSENLYRFNVLKSTISSEKDLKVGLMNAFLGIGVCVIGIIVFAIVALLIKYIIRLSEQDKSSMEPIYFINLYYIFLTIALGGYALFMLIMFYKKYMKIYDAYYEVDNIFNSEPSIQHLISMMTIADRNFYVSAASKNIRCQGTNPLIGFFIHQNRGQDVRYDCAPSTLLARPQRNDCLGTRKSFNFSSRRNVPYSLTKESLLALKNIPCSNLQSNNNRIFVDPFVGKSSIVGNSEVLKKKLDKFDIYGQFNTINNAILYFETILSRDAMGSSSFLDEIRNEISDHMKLTFDLSHIIITTNLTPSLSFLDNLPSQRKKELISREEFLILCKVLPISFGHYNTQNRTGYLLDENDVVDMVIAYSPHSGPSRDDENRARGEGGIQNISIIKQNMTPNGLSNPSLNIAISGLPPSSILESQFRPSQSKNHERSENIAFEADIDMSRGTMSKQYEDSYLVPRTTDPRNAPSYMELFNMNVTNQNASDRGRLMPVMFVYQITSESFILQSRSSFLSESYDILKDIILDDIVEKVGRVDSAFSIEIDTLMERDVRTHLEQRLGDDFKFLATEFMDAMNEIVIKIGTRRREMIEMKRADPDDKISKYITFEMFMIALQSMKQEEFLQKFVYNLDNLRHTSTGLKQMNDKFNYSFMVEEKNNIMLEVSFYFLVSIGLTELARFSFMRYVYHNCDDISLNDQLLDAKKRYEVDMNDDDKKTRMAKDRESKKAKEKILRSKIKSRNRMILYISIGFFIYILSVSLMYAWKEKSRSLSNYNKYVLETNGNNIVVDAEHALQNVIHLITVEKQFFFLGEKYKETGDGDELFYVLNKHAQIDKGKDIIWTMPSEVDKEPAMKRTYLELINIIENYKKCNMLVDSKLGQVPFPLLDTITYIMLILILIGVLLFAVFKLTPRTHYKNILNWIHISKLMDEDVEIEPMSFDFVCHESDEKRKISYNAITLIVAIIIVILGVLLATSLFRNSSQFATKLYSSSLFADMKCYGS